MSMSERSTAAKPRLEASMPIPSVTVFSVKFSAGIVTLRNRPSMSDTKKADELDPLFFREPPYLGHIFEVQHVGPFLIGGPHYPETGAVGQAGTWRGKVALFGNFPPKATKWCFLHENWLPSAVFPVFYFFEQFIGFFAFTSDTPRRRTSFQHRL